jgi:hypothetical protein
LVGSKTRGFVLQLDTKTQDDWMSVCKPICCWTSGTVSVFDNTTPREIPGFQSGIAEDAERWPNDTGKGNRKYF